MFAGGNPPTNLGRPDDIDKGFSPLHEIFLPLAPTRDKNLMIYCVYYHSRAAGINRQGDVCEHRRRQCRNEPRQCGSLPEHHRFYLSLCEGVRLEHSILCTEDSQHPWAKLGAVFLKVTSIRSQSEQRTLYRTALAPNL